MFITCEEKDGTCYLEFQFCKINKPLKKKNRVAGNHIEYWKKDSLLITDDDFFDYFYKSYESIFNCALSPDGEEGFDPYDINYYDKKTTKKILSELENSIDEKYKILIPWLKDALYMYNGFYILGL